MKDEASEKDLAAEGETPSVVITNMGAQIILFSVVVKNLGFEKHRGHIIRAECCFSLQKSRLC